MKKSFIFTVFAALLFLAGCKPPVQEGGEYTRLTFTETAVQVGIDGTYQLYLDWEPIQAADPTAKCTWASSNEAVATVNQGMITGVAQGKCNITATLGELKAIVEVEVLDPLQAERQAVEFSQMVMYSWNPQYKAEHILETGVAQELSIGTVNCDLVERPIYLLGSGIAVGEKEIVGEDFEVYMLLPVWEINEPSGSVNAKYNGYYVSSPNSYTVGAKKGEYVAEAGHFADINKYFEFLDKYMLQEDVTWAQANAAEYYFDNLQGAILQYHDYDSENSGEVEDGTSWTMGFMTSGIFDWDDDRNLLYVDLGLRWFDDFYGAKINDDETDLVRPFEYVYTDIMYSNAELASAPARRAAAHRPNLSNKIANKSIKNQLSKEFEAFPIKANVKIAK